MTLGGKCLQLQGSLCLLPLSEPQQIENSRCIKLQNKIITCCKLKYDELFVFSLIRNDAWKTRGAHIHLRVIIHRMHNNTISHIEIRECLSEM